MTYPRGHLTEDTKLKRWIKKVDNEIAALKRGGTETRPATRYTSRSEPRSFILGTFDEATVIAPMRTSVNPDHLTPEIVYLWGVAGSVRIGSVTIDWYLNDAPVTGLTGQVITTDPDAGNLTLPALLPLAHGDRVRPVITAVDSTPDTLEGTAFFIRVFPEGVGP